MVFFIAPDAVFSFNQAFLFLIPVMKNWFGLLYCNMLTVFNAGMLFYFCVLRLLFMLSINVSGDSFCFGFIATLISVDKLLSNY